MEPYEIRMKDELRSLEMNIGLLEKGMNDSREKSKDELELMNRQLQGMLSYKDALAKRIQLNQQQ